MVEVSSYIGGWGSPPEIFSKIDPYFLPSWAFWAFIIGIHGRKSPKTVFFRCNCNCEERAVRNLKGKKKKFILHFSQPGANDSQPGARRGRQALGRTLMSKQFCVVWVSAPPSPRVPIWKDFKVKNLFLPKINIFLNKFHSPAQIIHSRALARYVGFFVLLLLLSIAKIFS